MSWPKPLGPALAAGGVGWVGVKGVGRGGMVTIEENHHKLAPTKVELTSKVECVNVLSSLFHSEGKVLEKKEAGVKLEKERETYSENKETLSGPEEIESCENQSGSWTYSEVD